MIFPKCMTGRMPFITCHGYVMPCCWLDIPRYNTNFQVRNNNWELVDNLFIVVILPRSLKLKRSPKKTSMILCLMFFSMISTIQAFGNTHEKNIL